MTDIVVSYARADRELVAPLVDFLRAEGWLVWWDADATLGERFEPEIRGYLAQAGCVLVVWSEHSLASRYVHDEATEAAERGVLVPIALGGAQPPLGFRSIQTLRCEASALAGGPKRDELRARLAAMLGDPDRDSGGPGRHTGRAIVHYLPGHAYPPERPCELVGRGAELARLSNWFRGVDARGNGLPILLIQARPGLGKSYLAWHWVDKVLPRLEAAASLDHPPIWWSFAKSSAQEFLRFALGLIGSGDTFDDLLMHLRSKRLLLVFDALERRLGHYALAEGTALDSYGREERPADRMLVDPGFGKFLRALAAHENSTGRVLMTSREAPEDLPRPGASWESMELGEVAPAAAAAILEKSGARIPFDEAQLAALMERVGGHPLALSLVGLELSQPGEAEGRLDRWLALHRELPRDLQERMDALLTPVWARLSEAARRILAEIALHREPVGWDAILRDSELPKEEVGQGLRQLTAGFLLDQLAADGRWVFGMHALVRDFAFGRLGEVWGGNERALPRKIRARPGEERLLGPPPDAAGLASMPRLEARFERLADADRADEAVAFFQDRLAYHLFYTLADYRKAKELLAKVTFEGRTTEGDPWPLHSDLEAWAANLVANCQRYLGEPARAARLHALVLEWDRASGGSATNRANRQGNLGIDLRLSGDIDGAIEHLEEALAVAERESEVSTIASLAPELVRALLDAGDIDGAGRWAERGIECSRQVTQYRAKALLAKAETLREAGGAEAALALCREAEQSLPPPRETRLFCEVLLAQVALQCELGEKAGARTTLAAAAELAAQLDLPPVSWLHEATRFLAEAWGACEPHAPDEDLLAEAERAGANVAVARIWLWRLAAARRRGDGPAVAEAEGCARRAANGWRVDLASGRVMRDDTRRRNESVLRAIAVAGHSAVKG